MKHKINYEIVITLAQEMALWAQAVELGLCDSMPRYRRDQKGLVFQLFKLYGQENCLRWANERIAKNIEGSLQCPGCGKPMQANSSYLLCPDCAARSEHNKD